MSINETIPLFDLPVDFLVDDNIRGNILELYKMFPCQIKAGIFALCIEGEIKSILHTRNDRPADAIMATTAGRSVVRAPFKRQPFRYLR